MSKNLRIIVGMISVQVAYVFSIYLNFYGWLAERVLVLLDIPYGNVKDGNDFVLQLVLFVLFSIFAVAFGVHSSKGLVYRKLLLTQFLFCILTVNVGGFMVCYSC